MHRCFQLDEILCNVLDHVLTLDYRRSAPRVYDGSGTLLALARTCKLFSDPALDRLWYCLDGLVKLARCLPRDAWIIEESAARKRKELRLQRDLRPEDYARLYFYSQRVHLLDTRNNGFPETHLHHLVMPTILSRRPDEVHLTPNLERLVTSLHDFAALAWHPAAVLGPNLKAVQLWVTRFWYEGEPTNVLEATWRNWSLLLTRIARSMEKISIHVDDENENEPFDAKSPEGLISLLRRLKHIQKLDIVHVEITAKLLRRFLALRTLKTLAFTMYALEMEEFIEAPEKLPESICDLDSLTMRIDDLDLCYRLVDQIARPSLRKLGITRHVPEILNEPQVLEEHTHLWDVDLLLADLSQKAFLANLTEIEIIHPKAFNILASAAPEVSKRTIEPLLQIRTLQHLRLSLFGTVNFDKETLKAISQAWPDLRVLSLHERTVGTIPRISLLDVLTFTSTTPNLSELYIRFDATHEHYEIKDLQGFSQCKTLDLLDVCTSPIRNAEVVAQLLTVAFPSLTQVLYGWLYDDVPEWNGEGEEFRTPTEAKYCDTWEEVVMDMHVA